MTDEQMDARLHRAGEAWRAATPSTVADVQSAEPHGLTPPLTPRPRHHRTGLLASAALVAAAFVAGASVLVANITGGSGKNAPPGADVALQGTVWQFVGYGDRLDEHSLSTLYISPDGHLVADDECEVLGARANPSGDLLAVDEIVERFKPCVDTYAPAFHQGIDLLKSTPAYSIDANGLTIGTGADAMHFVPAAQLPAPTLDIPTFTETKWQLVSVTGEGNAPRPASEPLQLYVGGNQLTADAGCTTVSGTVTLDGSHVTLDEGNVGAPSCAGDGGLVQQVLSGGFTQQVRGAELIISKDGVGSLTYEWVPADAAATDPANLVGRSWYLASVAGQAPAGPAILNFGKDGTLAGDDGCRKINATATVGHGVFETNLVAQSTGTCSDDRAAQATTIDSFLSSGPELWSIRDGQLIIDGGGAQAFALVFQLTDPNPPPDNQSPALVGTPWVLAAIKDANGADVPVAGNGAFSIDADGHLKGNDGCNVMTGDVQIGDQTIDFGSGLAITEMACSDDNVMTTAQHVDAMLQGQVTWSIDGNELTLHKDGVGTLVFRAGASDSQTGPPLVNTTWTLTTIEQGGADGTASSVVTQVTVVFDAAGHVTITHRCYIDQADADIAKGTLDITHKQLERAIPCAAEPTQQQEQDENQVVDDVLSGQSTWTLDQSQLTITKDGVGALVFTG